jgi:hypothetical protein
MRRHEMDPLSLVSGLMFTAIGAVFLFGRVDVASAGAQWVWPALLVTAGALLMVLTVRPARENRRPAAANDDSTAESVQPGEPPEAAPGWPDEG